MYPITNDLLTRFQNGDKQYVRMTMGATVIDGSDIMQGSFSINRYVETNESVAVGSVVAAELTCVLNNYDGTYDNTSFIGSEAYVEVGVEDGNHVVQYIPMGYFIFDEATRTKNTISLAALDRMAKFDDPIVASSFSFPYTLTNLLSRICTLCSVTKGTFTLTNSSYSVAELPEETKTYRDLLRWICEVSGSNGYISYDGKLYLGWYGTTSQFNILPSNRTQSELDPNTFTITGVTILTGDNNKYTAGTNTRPITITNNPLINTTTAQSVANTLNTKLNGFSYTPFNAVMLPSPMIYPMDRATFTTAEGTTVAVSVTEVTFKLNGNTAIACKGEMTVKGRAYGLADQTFYASNIAAGSITADKIAAGAVNADKIAAGSVSVSMMDSSAQAAMLNSNVAVGGRNLAMDSKKGWTSTIYNVIQGYMSEAWVTGETYTVSIKGTPTTGKRFGVWSDSVSTNLLFMPTTPTDGKYVATAVCQGSTEPMRFSVYDYPSEGTHNSSIEWIKIEKGNVATDWSPAPEDATEMEQRIYYRSSSSTAPTAPSTWVTATTTANATWTTKRMAYDQTYKYLYTCIQRKTGSNVITNSTVLLDDTTTVIDGGNIITGSIAANKVDVNGDLSAFNATIGGWQIGEHELKNTQGSTPTTYGIHLYAPDTVSGTAISINDRGQENYLYLNYDGSLESSGNLTGVSQTDIIIDGGTLYSQKDYTEYIGGTTPYEEDRRGEVAMDGADFSLTDSKRSGDTLSKPIGKVNAVASRGYGSIDVNAYWDTNQHAEAYIDASRTGVSRLGLSMIDNNTTKGRITAQTTNTLAKIELTEGSNTAQLFCDGDEPQLRLDDTHRNTQKLYRGRSYNMYYNGATNTNYSYIDEGTLYLCKGAGDLRDSYPTDSSHVLSKLGTNSLVVNTHDLLRMSPHFAQMFATEITGNANLNTTTYLKVGQYYCQTTTGFTNSPTGNQFVMEVIAMIRDRYDDESGTADAYRVRKITDYIGNQFIQYCSKPTNGSWSYGTWQKIITGADSVTELSSTGNITTSTSMAYTGKSLTLPSAGWWAIEGYASYSNSAPVAIAINREVGSYYYELAYAERHGVYDKTVQYLRTSCVGYYDANSVIKLFARYGGANSNGVGLTAKKLH